MTNVPNTYNSMISSSSLPAPVMTSNLKIMGDGSMRNGLENLVFIANKQGELTGLTKGIKIGGIRGFLAGSLVTSVVLIGSYYLYEKYLEKEVLDDNNVLIDATTDILDNAIDEMEDNYGNDVCTLRC